MRVIFATGGSEAARWAQEMFPALRARQAVSALMGGEHH